MRAASYDRPAAADSTRRDVDASPGAVSVGCAVAHREDGLVGLTDGIVQR